jgi:hypothetical protein
MSLEEGKGDHTKKAATSQCGLAPSLAERAGFEPAIPFEYTAFRERLLKPLGHLSTATIPQRYAILQAPDRRTGPKRLGRDALVNGIALATVSLDVW